MKKIFLFSLLASSLLLFSCSAIQIVTEPGTEQAPQQKTKKTGKQTNKVVLKPSGEKVESREKSGSIGDSSMKKRPGSDTSSKKKAVIIKKKSSSN